MEVAVINYNAGNIRSMLFALERLGVQARLTNKPEEIRSADKVIFPGVGEASSTMNFLRTRKLDQVIRSLKQPLLGVCLGMQLLCRHSEEGDTACLGLLPLCVRKFKTEDPKLKVPHMGWNMLKITTDSWIPSALQGEQVYFVHSYYVENSSYASALCAHGSTFCAAFRSENFYATQFHPEKSGPIGRKILEAFLNL